ncbi:C45 family autoproteolytic acyltransferase/hydolase [Beduini massiliensis]|uniref:C45 family autoproteolytic acyltransferase/hydolase n=1 Tax=Beduini massiliensis TaxID=1585974 RepID=UPI00059AA364|nr:C45 family peptidase [Beduini massiliensis]
MNHSEFKGTHYQSGYEFGSKRLKAGITLNTLPILFNEPERLQYVRESQKIYEVYYPEILEEIEGVADGVQMDSQILMTFLLSMYSYTANNFCTSFAIHKNGKTFLGRNSDFACHLEESYDSCYYSLDDCYAFIGNTTAFTQMEDGINEHGLAAGLTFIYPVVRKPGFNAGFLVRYILEKCRNVKEAIETLKRLPIGSSQTLVLADRYGDIALVECNAENIEVQYAPENGFVVAANDFHLPTMTTYKVPIEDGIHSKERYQTAFEALTQCDIPDIPFIKKLLSGEMGFMCQYDRKLGMDTVWSSLYDLNTGKIYRAEGNPSRTDFQEDHRLNKE